MGGLFRLLRRVVVYGIGALVLIVIGALAAYYSGAKLPVRADDLPVVFPNWNKTNTVQASVFYNSELWRDGGRTHLTVNLKMPEAVERLKAFLDGGRTQVVACGPQKLFLHSLLDGTVGIEGDVITIDGMMDMELGGVITARDDMALSTAIRISHDRTTISADVLKLKLGQIPEPMIQTVLKQKSKFTLTREQVFDLIARDLSPRDAELLAKHREALDLAIESVRPARDGNSFHLDAVISVDEGAMIGAAVDRFAETSGQSATGIARMLGPAQAHAQLFKELEKIGKQLQGELERNPGLRNLLTDPEAGVSALVAGMTDCKVTF